jgi:hypothetical protein
MCVKTKGRNISNLPTIPKDQTSDFLLYFRLEIDSGAIQRIGPISFLVYKYKKFPKINQINQIN